MNQEEPSGGSGDEDTDRKTERRMRKRWNEMRGKKRKKWLQAVDLK